MDARPNILFLMADQHRWDAVGRAGLYDVRTPNLDRLADEGAFFTHSFTPMPICAPSRQCLASGRMADSFGGFWNYDMGGLPCKSFHTDGSDWQSRLHESGYRTSFFGHWHASEGQGASDFGYETVVGNEAWQAHVREKYPGQSYQKSWFGEESFLELEDSLTHYMASRAVEELRAASADGRPFFLRLDYTDPHLPCRPSRPFSRMYDPASIRPWASFGDDFEGKPYIQRQMLVNWHNEGKRWEDWTECAANYYGMISQLDDSVGRILHALDELGLRENTLVIYTSDHGDTSGGHGMIDKHYVLYDDNCRIPFILRWPGHIRPGLTVDAFTSVQLDLPVTIEEICGLAPSGERHGLTLTPLFGGGEQPERDDFAVSSSNGQQFGFFCNRSIRTRDWRYVWNLTDVDELYYLPDDPGEKRNVARDPANAEVLASLRRKLYGKLIAYGDPFAKGWVGEQLTLGRKL